MNSVFPFSPLSAQWALETVEIMMDCVCCRDCDGLCMEEIVMGCEHCRDQDGLCVL